MEKGETESELFPSHIEWDDAASYSGLTPLHSGSLSDTWRVRKAGKYFLAKTPHSKDSASIHRLRREFEIASGIDHPNIASVFTYETIEGIGNCILMEYVDGITLNEFLDTGAPLRIRKKIAAELLSAVRYLHRKGIIHNDLKPENILVSSRDANLKLIDFGLSDDDTHLLSETLGCTPAYAAPELLATGRSDARSDIYSIGLILKQIFPKRYAAIAAKCCRKDPGRRYEDTDSVIAAMRRSDALRHILPAALGLAAIVAALMFRPGHSPAGKTASAQAGTPQDTSLIQPAAGVSDGADIASSLPSTHDTPDALYETVRSDADHAMDSLFRMYSDKISRDADVSAGWSDISCWCLEFKYVRECGLERLDSEKQRIDFNAHCELRQSSMYDDLVDINYTLPDVDSALTPDEINNAATERLKDQEQLRRRLFGD